MNKREIEIAAVAASVAAGCVKCLKYHKGEALAAGLTEDDILKITSNALMIRRKANDFNIGDLDEVLNDSNSAKKQTEESPEGLTTTSNDSSCCG
ncbi:MAG: carboxymuconolactone decarboxylase family protein [Candidatus Hodarchaeales archaeon]